MVDIEYDLMPIGQQCANHDCVFQMPAIGAIGTNSICQCTYRLFQSNGDRLKDVERYVEKHLRDKNRELLRLQQRIAELEGEYSATLWIPR